MILKIYKVRNLSGKCSSTIHESVVGDILWGNMTLRDAPAFLLPKSLGNFE
jgi:hypothetical protein